MTNHYQNTPLVTAKTERYYSYQAVFIVTNS
nr:MAG TPA: hypothetical protein [Bacteriophage sp.]DAV71191.1 MAG TPA: hypothetical protein [Bacteriophage sp.]